MGDQVRVLAGAFVYLKWTDGRSVFFQLDDVDGGPHLADFSIEADTVEGEPEGNMVMLRPGKRQSVSLKLSGRGPHEPASDQLPIYRWRCADPTHPLHGMEMRCTAGPAVTDDLATRLRAAIDVHEKAGSAIAAAHWSMVTKCQAAIERGSPWSAGVHDGRDPEERQEDRALAVQAKAFLRLLAKAYGIEVPT